MRIQVAQRLVTPLLLLVLTAHVSDAKMVESMACKDRSKTARLEKDKTVVDYLLEVPADLLKWYSTASGKPFTVEERFSRIRICDEKNGYLEIDNSDLDGDWIPVVAYFRRSGRPPLLGFGFQNSHLTFLEKRETGWVDVSTQMMPPQINDDFINNAIRRKSATARKLGPTHRFTDNASDPAVIYELPRKGRFIRAVSGNGGKDVLGRELFKLGLSRDGAHFEIVP